MYAGRGLIPNRVDISQRPPIVDKQKRIGDFEVDLVEGTKTGKAVLVTIVDRKTNYLLAAKAPNKSAAAVARVIIQQLKHLKKHLHTITSDNGKEFANHVVIASKLAIDYFFATPYAPWQRGTNEHVNGLLRQYYPKGTNFATVKLEHIQQTVQQINSRPRKKLNFLNPLEVLLDSI